MKQYSTILFIVLVVCGMSNAFEFNNLSEVQELKKDSYASNLIQTISLSMANKDSVVEIRTLLEDLLKDLAKDETKLDNDYDTEKTKREKSIAAHEATLVKLRKAKGEQEDKRDKNALLMTQANKNLKQYNAQVTCNNEQLSDNKDNRIKDHAAYKLSTSNHKTLCGKTGLFDLVIAELSKLKGSVMNKQALEGNSNTTKNLTSQISADDSIVNGFTQMTSTEEINLFAQLATSADQGRLTKLIEFLKKMKLNCLKSWKDDQQKEKDSSSTYKSLKGKLTRDNVKLAGMSKTQNTNFIKYTKRFNDAVVEIKRLNAEIKLNVDAIVLLKKELVDLKVTYEKQKYIIKCNRKTIVKISGIFERKISNISKSLKGRLE